MASLCPTCKHCTTYQHVYDDTDEWGRPEIDQDFVCTGETSPHKGQSVKEAVIAECPAYAQGDGQVYDVP